MWKTVAGGALCAFALSSPSFAQPQTDRTVPVKRGTRLELNAFAGELVLRGWARDELRVQATHGRREEVAIDATDAVVHVEAKGRMGPATVDFEISVPVWMPIRISGPFLDSHIEGTQADITVETVRGDLVVRGGSGFISLKSVEGAVSVEGARGRVEVNAINRGIRLSGISGEIVAEAINGPITLDRIDSSSVDASTVNGTIAYDGGIKNDGRYTFTTHNGDIIVAVPEHANVAVSVRTFGGAFESSFPVKVPDASRGKRLNFTLGSGSARLELETFNGTIRLRRPGSVGRSEREEK